MYGLILGIMKSNQLHTVISSVSTIVISAGLLLTLNSCYTTPGVYNAPDLNSNVKNKVASSRSSSSRTLYPTVKFPARIAIAQVSNESASNLYLVNKRDLETDEHRKIVASLPHIAGVTHINSAYLPSRRTNIKELRKAAQRLGSNMLALYQFNTSSRVNNGSTVLSVATLGAAPTNGTKATANVSITFIDASNGYIYGVAEEQATKKALSSTWGAGNARKRSEHKANQEAFNKLMKNLPNFWNTVAR